MSMDKPAPLSPESCDLRGLNYMPLFGGHLYGSDFYTAADDAEFRAGMALYWAAWCQVPAGSLPNNDRALCHHAGLGRDDAAWQRVRAGALHGFIECSDGRLYHPFLCEQAQVAWQARVASRERQAKYRAKKSKIQQSENVAVTVTETATKRRRDANVTTEAKRRDVADLKISDVASLCNATPAPAAGTTGQTAQPSAPPSLVAGAGVQRQKTETKQPALKVAVLKPPLQPPTPEASAKWDSVSVGLGMDTLAAAVAAGVPWPEQIKRVIAAQAQAYVDGKRLSPGAAT